MGERMRRTLNGGIAVEPSGAELLVAEVKYRSISVKFKSHSYRLSNSRARSKHFKKRVVKRFYEKV